LPFAPRRRQARRRCGKELSLKGWLRCHTRRNPIGKEKAAAQDEGDTGEEDASPFGQAGTRFDQFLHRFFEQPFRLYHRSSQLHCHQLHVVADVDKVTVIFQDNNRHVAKVIDRDGNGYRPPENRREPNATLRDLGKQRRGQGRRLGWRAVGNPFGLGGSVTTGIVSAPGPKINEGPYDGSPPIDVPINRGNSGPRSISMAR
jgi:hypothetical protein